MVDTSFHSPRIPGDPKLREQSPKAVARECIPKLLAVWMDRVYAPIEVMNQSTYHPPVIKRIQC